MLQPRFLLLVLMICIPAALRLVDHPWNLAPVGALALFAGAHFREKRWAFFVPIGAMLLSDVGMAVLKSDLSLASIQHNVAFYTFHSLALVVYGCYGLSVVLGICVRRSWDAENRRAVGAKTHTNGAQEPDRIGRAFRRLRKVVPVASATLAGALLFFVITNFGVWIAFNTYPQTWGGLLLCYERAIPFFRTTLAGDAIYVVVLFGGYALLKSRLPVLADSSLLHAE